jgi:hypothetical protein
MYLTTLQSVEEMAVSQKAYFFLKRLRINGRATANTSIVNIAPIRIGNNGSPPSLLVEREPPAKRGVGEGVDSTGVAVGAIVGVVAAGLVGGIVVVLVKMLET